MARTSRDSLPEASAPLPIPFRSSPVDNTKIREVATRDASKHSVPLFECEGYSIGGVYADHLCSLPSGTSRC